MSRVDAPCLAEGKSWSLLIQKWAQKFPNWLVPGKRWVVASGLYYPTWQNSKVITSSFFRLLTIPILFPDGSVYWELEKKPPTGNFPFYLRASSAEVELTSYVLLALLNQSNVTPKDLSYMSQIVQWVVKQQNPYGGFSSSQVTFPSC